MTGRRGGSEATELLKLLTGEVLVLIEVIVQQGIHLIDIQRSGMILSRGPLEPRPFRQFLLQLVIRPEIHRLDSDLLSVHVGRRDVPRGRQSQAEITDTLQVHMVAITQVVHQLIVQFRQDRTDVTHGQGTALMYIPGYFNRIHGSTVGHAGMKRRLAITPRRSRRRIDVEFDRHVSLDEFISSHLWRACLT